MRVLHVIDSGGLYGAEQVILTLIEGLAEIGVECSLASIGEPGVPEKPLEEEARRRGLDVRRQTMSAGPDWRSTRAMLGAMEAEGFDLLHSHGYKANTLVACQSRARRRVPVVATVHGWTATGWRSLMALYQMAERLALRRVDQVVAVSEVMVTEWNLRRRFGARLTVIHNGVLLAGRDAGKTALPDAISSFVGDRHSIFAVGRLSREKGFDVLIDALAELRADGMDVCLVLAGEGVQRPELERRASELGIDKAVLMPGYLHDAAHLMRHFDLLAIPSRTEGLPIVMLEALLSGVPVAATAVGEMPAVLSSCDAGGCVLPGDAASLAHRLHSLLAEPRDKACLGRIADLAAERYSASSMVAAYKNVYEEQLSTR